MSTMEIETGTYIKRFAFWNPATWGIPKLYWDAISQEQRLHAICRQLEKVIAYADYIGVNVDDIAARLKAIEEGQLDELIVAAIEAWFDEHAADITLRITTLEEALPVASYDSEHTVKDAIDANAANIDTNTANIAQNAENVNILEKKVHTEPNFRCIDRFIVGESGSIDVSSAQAGCVFKQNDVLYWAQILNSDTANKDRLVIRNILANTEVANVEGQWGHGYTMSYNPTLQYLMTQDSEQSPYEIIKIDVSNPAYPSVISRTSDAGWNIDNPCWYDEDHIIAFTQANELAVFDENMTEVKTYSVDWNGYSYGNGYVFQNISWNPDAGQAYFGTTQPDGIVVCNIDEENSTVKMIDFIAMKPYYGFLYMRELEFAMRCEDKMYINQFDYIDNLLVVALLEWDMINGTIPNENSKYIQPTGNVGFTINYETGQLVQNSSAATVKYKLAGDAINELKSLGGYSRGYLIFETDYPHVVYGKSCKLAIQTNAAEAITIAGFYLPQCDVFWSPSVVINILPSINLSAGGQINHIGFRTFNTKLKFYTGTALAPNLVNPDSLANAKRYYFEDSEITAIHATNVFAADDWFRWCVVNTLNASDMNLPTKQNTLVNTVN